MSGSIGEVIRVKKKELRSTNEHLPATQPDHRTRQLNLDSQPFSVRTPKRLNGQLSGIVHGIKRTLIAVSVEVLTEVSLPPKQADSDDRHTKVARRLHLVARDIAEAARVNRQSFASA